MIPFREYKKDCMFKNGNLCAYWEQSTECHILSCPFYSNQTSTRTRTSLQRRKQDSVTFSPDDLDKTGNSVKDIIDKSRESLEDKVGKEKDRSVRSSVTEKPVTRLTCLACGEQIFDDKFTTIRDPHGVVIYLHSKGKCEVRHEHMPIVRKRWLKMHNYAEKVSESEKTEANEVDN